LKLLVTNPNFLILDEPTNDFDIDTLNVLEDFLEKFNGCLLLVSHDRYFMDHLVDQLFIFEGDGKVRLFNGNYSDYRDWLEDRAQAKAEVPAQHVVVAASIEKPVRKRKISFKEKQEYERLQGDIDALEKRKAVVTDLLTAGSTDHHQLQQWAAEIENILRDIDEKSSRWLELSDFAE
jgi:ATP-binding cassette subfamily F protein uup